MKDKEPGKSTGSVSQEALLRIAEAAAVAEDREQLWTDVSQALAPALDGLGLAVHLRDPRNGDYSTRTLVPGAPCDQGPDAAWLDRVLLAVSRRENR